LLDSIFIGVILSSPPYTISSVDGLLSCLGIVPKLNFKVSVFLVNEGVWLAKKGQQALNGIYVNVAKNHGVPFHEVNFEKALKRLIDEKVDVYILKDSIEERFLKPSDIIEGVNIVTYEEMAKKLLSAKAVLFF